MPSASASAASVPTTARLRSKVSARIGNTSAARRDRCASPGQLLGRRVVVDDNQEVDVAVAGRLATRPRAEQDHPLRLEIGDYRVEQVARYARLGHRPLVNLGSRIRTG